MPRHSLMDGQLLKAVGIVFAELRFDTILWPIGRDGCNPVERTQLRFERGSLIKTSHRIAAAHELGRRDHLQVRASGKRYQMLRAYEVSGFFEIFASFVEIG